VTKVTRNTASGEDKCGVLTNDVSIRRSLFAFVLVFGFPAYGQETTQVERSRNGNIGFVSEREDDTEIFEMKPDGSGATQLTHNTLVTDLSPAWSPDGRKIAFVSSQPGRVNFNIYIMDADGSNAKKLTTSPAQESDPTWSPDGRKIAFVRDLPLGEGQVLEKIFIMNADGSDQVRLQTGGTISEYDPDWSPHGRKIAFIRSGGTIHDQIYTVNVEGSDLMQLTQDPDYTNASPKWSPDGSKILFSRFFGTSVASKYDVNVMNADGSDVENLTNQEQVHDAAATWSPDGREITFVRGDCAGAGQAPCDIWRMRADGSSQTQITRNTDDNYSPDWLPQGAGIPLTGNNGVGTGTGQGNAAGTGTASNGTPVGDQSDFGHANNSGNVINGKTSNRQLPNTGGLAIFAPAMMLLLISGAVARWLVSRR